MEAGHVGCRDGLQQSEVHVLRELMEEAATGAQQDGHPATASPMAGVLVGGAPRDSRPHSCRDGVEEPSARLTQAESVEHLARRVPVGVPVEEHGRVTETASELLVAVGSATTDIAVDRDGVGAEGLHRSWSMAFHRRR